MECGKRRSINKIKPDEPSGRKLIGHGLIGQILSGQALCEAIADRLRSALGRAVWTNETLMAHCPDVKPLTFFGLAVTSSDAVRPCKICGDLLYAFKLHFEDKDDGFWGLNDTCENCLKAYEIKREQARRDSVNFARSGREHARKVEYGRLVNIEVDRLEAKKEAKRRVESESAQKVDWSKV